MNMSGTRSDPPDISIRDGRSRVWTDFTLHDLKSESPEHSTPPSGQKNGFNFSKRPGLNIRCSTLPKDRLTDRSCFRPGRLPMPRPTMNDRLERELEYGGLRIKRRPAEYFRSDNVFVGCEGNEKALAYRHRESRAAALYVRFRLSPRDH